jgi:hypothetical protein
MKRPFESAAYGWTPDIDYRRRPELYRVGKGEQGVLICEPYKSELLPHWRFRTPEIAAESSRALYQMFLAYLATDDFPGADMARKYLQMGFTRARRYANYKGGRKYADDGGQFERGTGDPLKSRSAEIFYRVWQDAEANPTYASRKADWKKRYG